MCGINGWTVFFLNIVPVLGADWLVTFKAAVKYLITATPVTAFQTMQISMRRPQLRSYTVLYNVFS